MSEVSERAALLTDPLTAPNLPGLNQRYPANAVTESESQPLPTEVAVVQTLCITLEIIMTEDKKIAALEAFALANYDAGGHWIYESYDRDQYLSILADTDGHLGRAKRLLRLVWEALDDRCTDVCADC